MISTLKPKKFVIFQVKKNILKENLKLLKFGKTKKKKLGTPFKVKK